MSFLGYHDYEGNNNQNSQIYQTSAESKANRLHKKAFDYFEDTENSSLSQNHSLMYDLRSREQTLYNSPVRKANYVEQFTPGQEYDSTKNFNKIEHPTVRKLTNRQDHENYSDINNSTYEAVTHPVHFKLTDSDSSDKFSPSHYHIETSLSNLVESPITTVDDNYGESLLQNSRTFSIIANDNSNWLQASLNLSNTGHKSNDFDDDFEVECEPLPPPIPSLTEPTIILAPNSIRLKHDVISSLPSKSSFVNSNNVSLDVSLINPSLDDTSISSFSANNIKEFRPSVSSEKNISSNSLASSQDSIEILPSLMHQSTLPYSFQPIQQSFEAPYQHNLINQVHSVDSFHDLISYDNLDYSNQSHYPLPKSSSHEPDFTKSAMEFDSFNSHQRQSNSQFDLSDRGIVKGLNTGLVHNLSGSMDIPLSMQVNDGAASLNSDSMSYSLPPNEAVRQSFESFHSTSNYNISNHHQPGHQPTSTRLSMSFHKGSVDFVTTDQNREFFDLESSYITERGEAKTVDNSLPAVGISHFQNSAFNQQYYDKIPVNQEQYYNHHQPSTSGFERPSFVPPHLLQTNRNFNNYCYSSPSSPKNYTDFEYASNSSDDSHGPLNVLAPHQPYSAFQSPYTHMHRQYGGSNASNNLSNCLNAGSFGGHPSSTLANNFYPPNSSNHNSYNTMPQRMLKKFDSLNMNGNANGDLNVNVNSNYTNTVQNGSNPMVHNVSLKQKRNKGGVLIGVETGVYPASSSNLNSLSKSQDSMSRIKNLSTQVNIPLSASHNTLLYNRQDLNESPRTKHMFKEFYRIFRIKERESLETAKKYAVDTLSAMPEKNKWRVYLELAEIGKRNNDFEEVKWNNFLESPNYYVYVLGSKAL